MALLIVVMGPRSLLCGGTITKALADEFAILRIQQLPLLYNRLLEFVVQSETYYIVIGIAALGYFGDDPSPTLWLRAVPRKPPRLMPVTLLDLNLFLPNYQNLKKKMFRTEQPSRF